MAGKQGAWVKAFCPEPRAKASIRLPCFVGAFNSPAPAIVRHALVGQPETLGITVTLLEWTQKKRHGIIR
jgi:hypothetical protein